MFKTIFKITFLLIVFGVLLLSLLKPKPVQAQCSFYSGGGECSGRNNGCFDNGDCILDCSACPPPNQYQGSCPLGVTSCGNCDCGSAPCSATNCLRTNCEGSGVMCGCCTEGFGGCNQGASACTSCNNAGNAEACCGDYNHIGCTWSGGWCSGTSASYFCYQGGTCSWGTKSGCESATGCTWSPCANGSVCTNGSCTDSCGNSQPCGHYYTALSPSGSINTLTPNFIWSTDNTVAPNTYTNFGVFGVSCGNLIPGVNDTYIMEWNGGSVNDRSAPFSSLHCTAYGTSTGQCVGTPALLSNHAYSWNVYGYFPDATPGTSNCLSFTTPNLGCQVSITPSSLSVPVGQTGSATAIVTNISSGATLSSVTWNSANSGIATVTSPGSSTTVTGVSAGSTTISATANLSPSGSCTTNGVTGNGNPAAVTVTNPGPWWQVKDADVITSGSIQSLIPSAGLYFGINGIGGYHGIPTYGTTASFGSGLVSQSPAWIVNTTTNYRKTYNYAFFKGQIPSDAQITEITSTSVPATTFTSGGTVFRNYYLYHFNGGLGDLTITGDMALGSRRVVLLVEGADLNLNGKINLSKGSGFFMAVVGKNSSNQKGNINVASNVAGTPSLEGIFLAENQFSSGAGTSQLNVRGSIAAYGGINFQRNLGAGNSTTAGELFEYAPDLMALYPNIFSDRKIRWKEVAP